MWLNGDTVIQAEERASSKARRKGHPWQVSGPAWRPVWLEGVVKGGWRGWGQRGIGGKGEMDSCGGLAGSRGDVDFPSEWVGPLEGFEQWSGHVSSCLLTGLLWLPCGESKEEWGVEAGRQVERLLPWSRWRMAWVVVMEVASSGWALGIFWSTANRVYGGGMWEEERSHGNAAIFGMNTWKNGIAVNWNGKTVGGKGLGLNFFRTDCKVPSRKTSEGVMGS